jgi:hypothetical protein
MTAIKTHSRRDFLYFLGRTALTAYGASFLDLQTLSAEPSAGLPFQPIQPSDADELVLAKGFNYHIVAKWGDWLNKSEKFGTHNDFVTFIPVKGTKNEGILWVNHEYTNPLFINGKRYTKGEKRTREAVIAEMESVGGSIMKIKKDKQGNWQVVKNDPINKRITALTEIPFAWHEPIAGSKTAIGTLANCAGGQTPWGTALSCEENYDTFWGERDFSKPELPKLYEGDYGWETVLNHAPEHYGWVVEINPLTGNAKKLIALGRFAHEAATVWQMPDKRCVVYTGDDKENEHLYKFIASEPDSLEKGKLYVANTQKGEWISLDLAEQPILQQHFKSQTEVLIRCREAAKLVGATPLNRPEDIEIDPVTKDIFVCLTNNNRTGDLYGSILRITEKEGKDGLKFESKTFIAGGEDTGFACPDNMVFDNKGNLWFTSDMYNMNQGAFKAFKNNGLFFVPMEGTNAGKTFQVASAPVDAEFTGPCFSPDFQTLFLCVQHPGDNSKSLTELTSHFPEGGNSMPKSCLVGIDGKSLAEITKK